MSTNNQPQLTEPREQAAHNGVDAVLSAEALHNLTGWFDVLIQMDFAQKIRNEIRSKDENENIDLQGTPKDPA